MSDLFQHLAALPARAGLPWLLRGSVMTRALVAPRLREVKDVDWVDPTGVHVEAWREALPRLLAQVPDVEPGELSVVYAETPFPGARLAFTATIDGERRESRIEVAGGDPLTRPAGRVAGIPCVSTEDLYAWKVHGLFEFGRGRWRAKDLLDCALLLEAGCIDAAALPAALRAAFTSRGTPFAETAPLIEGVWGRSFSSGRKWRRFRKRYAHVDEEIEAVREPVVAFLAPLLAGLLAEERA